MAIKETQNEFKVIKEVKQTNKPHICFGFDNITYAQQTEREINEELKE